MKIKKIALSLASVALLAMPSYISANDTDAEDEEYEFPIDVSGELIGNYSVFTKSGATHNPELNADRSNKTHSSGSARVSEVKAKLYLNQDVTDNISWHSELDLNKDWSAINGYDNPRINTQFDWLRELYADITVGDDWSFRLGKQQVVWGKADGVKFLDIINPTDFRHWGQDSMEDSRIPLWMMTGEYAINDNSSLQVVYVPQVNITNQIPGLYNPKTGDAGQEFVPLGMDTILGQTNGFYNIGPNMGTIASQFVGAAATGAFTPATSLNQIMNLTVKSFTSMPAVPAALGGGPGNLTLGGMISNLGLTTNLYDANYGGLAGTNYNNPIHMFDYMGDTTFATFYSFNGMQTKYVKKHAKNDFKNGNIGFKYAGTNDDIGLNYTFNYYYHYDNNPVIDVSWEGKNGQALSVGYNNAVPNFSTVFLKDANGGVYDPTVSGPATMVFTETQNRVNSFGGSFDYAIDNDFAPIIIRSEMVYDKGTMQPVVDLGKLAIGDLAGAFTNKKADFLNYVVGADVTVLTNLFVSFQFMDKWNLDYVDEKVQYQGDSRQYSKHTANAATMSLANQFKKAEKHQIMYTFFLSKPFLEGDALRVNNIVLLENENGGYWDRLDFEYSYSDDIVLTGALNQYGGDKYGVFGQFVNSSNVQLGFKYIF